jgi:hypothetical protein
MEQPQISTSAVPHSGSSPRRQAAAILAGCLLVLLVAHLLPPDPRGYGTHTRLLLPPCTFKLLTGLPCPFCGMTTGFAALGHGDWQAAVRANVGAPLLYLLTWGLAIASLWGMLSNRPWIPRGLARLISQRAVVTALGLLWAVNLICYWTLCRP